MWWPIYIINSVNYNKITLLYSPTDAAPQYLSNLPPSFICQLVSQIIRQTVSQSVSQSYRQSVRHSARQRFSQPVRLSSDKSITSSSQWTNQSPIHAGNWYISQPAGKQVTSTIFQSFQLDFDYNYSATVHHTTI